MKYVYIGTFANLILSLAFHLLCWEGLLISAVVEGECRIVARENEDKQATFAEKVGIFFLWFQNQENKISIP